ncbi:Vitamin K epoxide reductase [Actinomadura sp. CNU-125]|uniref:vitamin K epoxide reductase family protein n=1 Tax=Actinomadura sp. CNU-125 TaxID=1904961 RepID=UPI0009662F9B|nr:vitamin K epoxide reductase family protein [Actinomadura sp. CNU-125]OLT35741.1 Vitamin K epoxide reductase [Actinomadura sp. CNU-125]
MTSRARPHVTDRLVAAVLTVGGAIGLLAAFALAVEKVALLQDPSHVPTCSINPILSCGSVMSAPQAEVLGFPNPFLGIVGFTVVLVVGVVMWTAAPLPRWFWLGLQTGTVLGTAFVHWLIVQSLYRINALCPYCMAVWAVVIPVFWYTTVYCLTRGHLPAPPAVRRVAEAAARYHAVIATGWYLLIAGLVLQRFWPYWTSLV